MGEFTPNRSDQVSCRSKECNAKRQRMWRARSDQPYYLGPNRQALTDWVEGLKSVTPCVDCNTTFPPECMDFDHVVGDKVAGIAYMISRSYPRDSIVAEMAKCELVCANCHRIRTRRRYAEDQVKTAEGYKMAKRTNSTNDAGKWEAEAQNA